MRTDLPRLRADKRYIKQIIVNLLSNAIKNTQGGRVTVGASVDPGGHFLIEVEDTGIGIAAADIPKALSPFGQIGRKAGDASEGTGLGLPLTKSLANLHGGSLRIQSEVGAGYVAKELCSCIFVGGRDPASCRPDIPPAMAELVLHMLAKKPEDRCASAGDVLSRLQQIVD